MNEREIAEKMIKDGKAMIERAESRLSALDKPKLRHGDYGKSSDFWIYISGKMLWTHEGSEGCWVRKSTAIETRLGNVFDDLKAMSEDLEEFTVGHYQCGAGIKVEILSDIHLWVSTEENGSNLGYTILSIDETAKFHRKLGQLIATAKRKQSSGV